MKATLQQLYGRKGRVVTDQDAKEITRLEELSYELKVQDVMSQEVQCVTPDQPMSALLNLLRQNRISGAPVKAGDRLVGVISQEDLMRALSENALEAPIKQYMTENVKTVKSYESVVKAIELFTEAGMGRLPVMDENERLVGVITKGDITRGVLLALQRDYHAEEIRRYRASHLFEDISSDRTSLILRYNIKADDFLNGGKASSMIKRALLRLGASPQLARQCGIAMYEAEMNLIIHTERGGILRVQIEPHRILMQATDDGPGIADIDRALTPGYSTATSEVRAMGFGAGMGLANIRRCVDKMTLESTPGKGTKLMMEILLQSTDVFKGGSPEQA